MSNEIDHIAELEKKLYARNPEIVPKRKFGILHPLKHDIESKWGETKLPPEKPRSTSVAGYKRFFIFTLVFFFIALGAALFSMYRGAQTLSSKNVEVSILGNSFVAGGEELPVQVEIANKNSSDLVNATLVLDYPKGATDESGSDVMRVERPLNIVASGKTRSETFTVVLYGEQGSARTINAHLSYQLAGSLATFEKEASFSVMVSSSPVALTVDAPSALVSNQPFTMTLHNLFTGDKLLNNVVARVEYPNGFVFESANPKPAYGNNVWSLGDLEKGTERTIAITGRLIGEQNDEKAFRTYIGTPEGDIGSRIAVSYNSVLTTMKIAEPFIAAGLSINGQKSDTVILPIGSTVNGFVSWVNNSGLTVTNPVFTIDLSGEGIDSASLVAPDSYYDPIAKTITWNGRSNRSLVSIDPGANGQLSFNFKTTTPARGTLRDIRVTLSLRGAFPDRDYTEQSIQNIDRKDIKFASIIDFTSQGLYSIGPIPNTGPYPPKAEVETTYSINWVLRPTENPLTGIVATATLPPAITWGGIISPQNESITYNPSTRLITWNAGSLPKASSTQKVRQVFFQVRARPTKAQIGDAITLLGESTVSATDVLTQSTITGKSGAVTTLFSTDPVYTLDKERVVP